MTSSKPKRLKMSEVASCSSTKEKESYFNFASSNFNDIVKMDAFMDKTLLIKSIFKETPMILITAPHRFGKSSNMDMIKTFVRIQMDTSGAVIKKESSSNYKIFKDNNLLIYQDQEFFKQYFATYSVISVSFKRVSGDTFDEILDKFRSVLRHTFEKHEYILKSDKFNSDSVQIRRFKKYYEACDSLTKTDIEEGMEFLSKCLYKHFNRKVFMLIDEYDAPMNNAMFETNIVIDNVNKLLCQIFSNALKENEYVERALLTGISYFAAVELSAINNIEKYMFLDNHLFVGYYGLIESEVDTLLSKFNLDDKEISDVKSFYNGYNSKKGDKLFSIWSVLHYLQQKVLMSYWQQSGLALGLNAALHVPVIQNALEKCLQNIPAEVEILNTIQLRHITDLKDLLLEVKKNIYINLICILISFYNRAI